MLATFINKVLLTPSRPAEGASAQDHKPTLPIYNSQVMIAFADVKAELDPGSTQSQPSPVDSSTVAQMLGQIDSQKRRLKLLQEENQTLKDENKRLKETGDTKMLATHPTSGTDSSL